MTDLRRRFATLDKIPTRLDWREVESRAIAAGAASVMPGRPTLRGGTNTRGRSATPIFRLAFLVAALVVAVVGSAALVGSKLTGPDNLAPSPPSASPSASPGPVAAPSNGWIAFSTQPGWPEVGHDYNGIGGDIYLVREGVQPRVIVSRGQRNVSNVCPAFSPDGSTLVFGHRDGSDRALVVLEVSAGGAISEKGRLDVPGGGHAPCPRWSSDGTRLAYLVNDSREFQDPRPGRIVVRGLDGSTLVPGPGDPAVEDLKRSPFQESPLQSPSGEWVALGDERGVVVQRPDGTDSRIVMSGEKLGAILGYPDGFVLAPFAIPAWSPDGRYVLAMGDVSGHHFALLSVSVVSPFESVVLASMVPVNSASDSSFPGFGDVSWQPVFPSSAPRPTALATP